MGSSEEFLEKLVSITTIVDTVGLLNSECSLSFNVTEKEYNDIFNFFQTKYKKIISKPKNEFSITIGSCKIVFNKSNV